jgi:hypothetical protein
MSPPHCFDRQINFPFSLVRIDLKKMATDLVDSADDTQTGQRSHVRGMAESTELKSSQPLPIERSFPVPSGGRHFSFTFQVEKSQRLFVFLGNPLPHHHSIFLDLLLARLPVH